MSIDKQAKDLIDSVSQQNAPPMSTLPYKSVRAMMNAMAKQFDPAFVEVGKVEDHLLMAKDGTISVRIYTPEGKGPFQVFVFFHGGGWITGNLDTHDNPLRYITNSSKCIIVSVDYRLAPEYTFPAAVEDAYAAVKWTVGNAHTFGGLSDKIAVGGDSAGGNISAALTLMARDKAEFSIRCQVLIYPVLDLTCDYPSEKYPSQREFARGYFLNVEDMEYIRDSYVPYKEDRQNSYASPIVAESLANLPPALVITNGNDPLRDEGKAYADRLKEAGVKVEYCCYEGMIHGFLNFGGVFDKTKELIAHIGNYLNKEFKQE